MERGSPGGKGGEIRTVAELEITSEKQNTVRSPNPQSVRAVADDVAPVNAEVPLGKRSEKATLTVVRGEEEVGPRWEIQKDGRWLRAKIEEAATGQTRKSQSSRVMLDETLKQARKSKSSLNGDLSKKPKKKAHSSVDRWKQEDKKRGGAKAAQAAF